MKYLPTILVNDQVYSLLKSGELKLPRGQWIKLAWCDKPSRWVGVKPGGTLWATHWEGKHDPDHFRAMCRAF